MGWLAAVPDGDAVTTVAFPVAAWVTGGVSARSTRTAIVAIVSSGTA
jgi:hypothetical protein